MKITKTFQTSSRAAWRAWLRKHAKVEKEVWLVYPRKASGRARISYNDAVEEALCFGWVDSPVKTLDAQHVVQRFSPRKRGSGYSQTNQERLRRLIKQHKVSKEVLKTLEELKPEEYELPPDIRRALQASPKAWANFQRYSPSYQRIRAA
jgi:uncharacterized protein YdeI (YjbR/CyaY-like superfamily)